MTIGIYLLRFTGTHRVYIGQSVNIEHRYTQHKRMLREGISAKRLQFAYDHFGEPDIEILKECAEKDLDFYETSYIGQYDSYEDGFNATIGGSVLPDQYGIKNPNAQYKEEDYYCVLYYLGEPGYSWKEISSITGVSESVVSHISAMESHRWLKEVYPEMYSRLEAIKNNGGRNYAFMQGIVYPKIKSPTGEIYDIKHQTNFAKEHNLSQPKLCEVLHGNRKSHKGWSLV